MYYLRSIVIIFSFTTAAFTADAQVATGDDQLPDISRVCLWNADQSTWKLLKLKRHQIERMNELRALYPAVVDGQWITHDEDLDQAPSLEERSRISADPNTPVSGPNATLGGTGGPISPAPTNSKACLQHEIRTTLMPVQLLRWANHCQ